MTHISRRNLLTGIGGVAATAAAARLGILGDFRIIDACSGVSAQGGLLIRVPDVAGLSMREVSVEFRADSRASCHSS